eukprot:TRINITY_DN55494_c0_g1_i1.p1 TRINITY_DN55494_c0_g1~~TRINITY_DN55494_c0_g1_i1.p1  ORF type:complete len:714 (+),score=104.06 TRINITY_DN55494_c0_g1_i1:190-2331(+)
MLRQLHTSKDSRASLASSPTPPTNGRKTTRDSNLPSNARSRPLTPEVTGANAGRKTTRDSAESYNTRRTASLESGGSSRTVNSGSSSERPTYGGRARKRAQARKTKASRSSSIVSGNNWATNQSRQSSRVGTSYSEASFAESSSSSDETLENEDWDNLEISHLPLYLREGRIRKEGEEGDSQGDYRIEKTGTIDFSDQIKIDEFGNPIEADDEEDVAQWDDDEESPGVPIYTNVKLLILRGMCFAVWAMVVTSLLGVYIARYYMFVRSSGQRIRADNSLLLAQVETSNVLQQALGMVRLVALTGRAGYFNKTRVDPFAVLTAIFTPSLLSSPAVKHVRIFGIRDQLLLTRRGLLFDEKMPKETRLPVIYALPPDCDVGADPLECLGANTSRVVPGPDVGAVVGWQKPLFIGEDSLGRPLDVTQWTLGHYLTARVNLSSSGIIGELGMEVAVNLESLEAMTRRVKPPGGAVYVCTEDGTLLAGSEWRAKATADPATGKVAYPTLWDLNMPWGDVASKEILIRGGRVEGWYGPDLVAVDSFHIGVSGGAAQAAARGALRAVVFAPFEASIRPILFYQAIASIVLVGLVVVVCFVGCCGGSYWVIVTGRLRSFCRDCRDRISRSLKKNEDDDESDSDEEHSRCWRFCPCLRCCPCLRDEDSSDSDDESSHCAWCRCLCCRKRDESDDEADDEEVDGKKSSRCLRICCRRKLGESGD